MSSLLQRACVSTVGSLLAVAGSCLAGPPPAAADLATIAGKVVGPARYIKNTVVGLKFVSGEFRPSAEEAILDQKDLRFVPRVLPVLKGTTVKFVNSDPADHTVFSPDAETYDLGRWGEGEFRSRTFDETGTYTQLCKLHPVMVAYIVVRENPFFDLTDETGAFAITNVPAGTYEIEVWNERMRAEPVKVSVEAGQTARIDIELIR